MTSNVELPNNSIAAPVEKFVFPCEKCLTPNSIARGGWFCATCTAAMMPKIYQCLLCKSEYSASSVDRTCDECHREGF